MAPSSERVHAPIESSASLWFRLVSTAKLALSFFTTCPHTNRHYTGYYQQACFDCGRVRNFGLGRDAGVWHKAVR